MHTYITCVAEAPHLYFQQELKLMQRRSNRDDNRRQEEQGKKGCMDDGSCADRPYSNTILILWHNTPLSAGPKIKGRMEVRKQWKVR